MLKRWVIAAARYPTSVKFASSGCSESARTSEIAVDGVEGRNSDDALIPLSLGSHCRAREGNADAYSLEWMLPWNSTLVHCAKPGKVERRDGIDHNLCVFICESTTPEPVMKAGLSKMRTNLIATIGSILISAVSIHEADAKKILLAKDGKALYSVVVSEDAGERVRAAAQTLADYLGRITGGTFVVESGDGSSGIAVGIHDDFPHTGAGAALSPEIISRADDFLLRSHANGLYVIGTTPVSVGHAVWTLLHHLGHRQFFPGPTWEVVPGEPNLRIAIDQVIHPDYPFATMFHSMGNFSPEDNKEINRWLECNRMINSRDWGFGHVYQELLKEYPEVFEKHPEYWALVNGKRAGAKLCLSNPGLRKLFVDRSLKWLKEHPEVVVISAEPTDGGTWCECQSCKALGGPSDRALGMANEIARGVDTAYPGVERYVGLMSYANHSPPPERVRAHPRVFMSFAQGFYFGQLIGMDLVDAWVARGVKQFGIYDYFSIYQWSHDMPGLPGVGALQRTARKIKDFHDRGAVQWMGEATNSWGPAGLGMYMAARCLWDKNQDVDELVDDFLTRCFDDAKAPMKTFYELTNGDSAGLVSDDLVGRMYRTLDAARKQTKNPQVRARIRDLILWTHYVELFRSYVADAGETRQAAFERMVRYSYRMAPTHMVASRPLYYYYNGGMDPKMKIPAEAEFEIKEEENPWKSSEPFTRDEINTIVKRGIAANSIHNIEPVAFSDALVPATPLGLKGTRTPQVFTGAGGRRVFYTWVTEGQQEVLFLVTTGTAIPAFRERGPAKIKMFFPADSDHVVAKGLAPPTGNPTGEMTKVRLPTSHTGLHRIEVHSRSYGRADMQPPALFVEKWTSQSSVSTVSWFSAYFFVPTGTKYVGGYSPDAVGYLKDGSGNNVLAFTKPEFPGYFHVEVPPGQDGSAWQFFYCGKTPWLMTVPSFMARSPEELLIPEEVLKRELTARRNR